MTACGGATIWLTGLPSAGKSSIAVRVAARLQALDRPTEILDGDEMRRSLCAELGFSRADRDTNVRRIGFVAALLARHGVLVLVPVIAPYAQSRAAVREHHRQSGAPYLEAYVTTPVDVCARRDVKGLYRRQRAGLVSGLTGVDDTYEVPLEPEIRVDTVDRTVDASADVVLAALAAHDALIGRTATRCQESGTNRGCDMRSQCAVRRR